MMIPKDVSLFDWASSLIVDFPSDNIPVLMHESHWKEWGDLLVQENSFAKNGSPGTQSYSEWKSWSLDLFQSMNNYS